MRGLLALAGLSMLAACAQTAVLPSGTTPPTSAIAAGLRAGPAVSRLTIGTGAAARALASFRESCPRLLKREDKSGLTRQSDWQAACTAAETADPAKARAFFARHFETVQVGNGATFATGYFEPQIAGVRERQPGFDVPVHAMPADLVRARPGDAEPLPDGRMPLGRYDAAGAFVPYFDRAAIEDGALAGRGLEIGWAADRVALFFLQVQGSGRLIAPDGSVMRIGYGGQNGHAYTSIGKLMRERGLTGDGPDQVPPTMQGLVQWLHANPEAGRAVMRENRSYIFFRELTGDGPVGALGIPVRPRVSAAADPNFVPLGAPVWLRLDSDTASGLWIAQDTGGAIKGANRFDTFWGAGDEARTIAGGLTARGSALVLLPRGTLRRLAGR